MLTSPITITIDGVAKNLPLINSDNFTHLYQLKETGVELSLTIRHAYEGKAGPGQMERHHVDLVRTTWDVDGVPTVQQSYHVIRVRRGTSVDSVSDDTVGLNAFLTTNIAAILAWQ